MKKATVIKIVLLISIVLVSCLCCCLLLLGIGTLSPKISTTNSNVSSQEPTDTTVEAICKPENDKKKFNLKGFAELGNSSFCMDTCSVNFYTYSRNDFNGKDISINTSLKRGTGANQMEAPGVIYTKEDIKIHDKNGLLIPYSQYLQLTGTLNYSTTSIYKCTFNADKITQLSQKDVPIEPIPQATAINFTQYCDPNNRTDFVSLEGYLINPSLLYSYHKRYQIDFYPTTNSKDITHTTANITIGKGINQMEPLSSQYNSSDVKIHDVNNGIINFNHKYRLTGLRSLTSTKGDKGQNLMCNQYSGLTVLSIQPI